MHSARLSQAWTIVLAIFAVVLMLVNGAWAAPRIKVLHIFTGSSSDGESPASPLIFDSAGNLYGTTYAGGAGTLCAGGCGTVFKLTPSGNGWAEEVLYSFMGGSDGTLPYAGLVADAAGNLYGTTSHGGSDSDGIVFELTPQLGGGYAENVLHTFSGPPGDGAYPYAALNFDSAGNLYGTTVQGGGGTAECFLGCGTVFKLTPSGNAWKEKLLYSFIDPDGASPYAGLIFGSAGNLYGTAELGGTYFVGRVFKLTPQSGGAWTEEDLYDFTSGDNGAFPIASVIFDAEGNLYGTTDGGGADDVGVVFKLTPTKGEWTIHVIHSFTGGIDGGLPYYGSLVMDKAGNLYGTTFGGGLYGYGTVFMLTKPVATGKWIETVLHSFTNGRDGAYPENGLIFDSAGNLYGTTSAGGDLSCVNVNGGNGCGTVFEIVP